MRTPPGFRTASLRPEMTTPPSSVTFCTISYTRKRYVTKIRPVGRDTSERDSITGIIIVVIFQYKVIVREENNGERRPGCRRNFRLRRPFSFICTTVFKHIIVGLIRPNGWSVTRSAVDSFAQSNASTPPIYSRALNTRLVMYVP